MKQLLLLFLLYLFHRTHSSSSFEPLVLDETALQQLSLKGLYQTLRTFDDTIRGVYVQDIAVPSSIVWDCLLLDASSTEIDQFPRRKAAVQVFDVPMTLRSWFRAWRGPVHYTYDSAHQTLTFETKELPQSRHTIGIWRVHSTPDDSSLTTRVSLVVDQTLSSTSWLPFVSSSSWVPSIVSQSTRRLTQCIESPARQQQHHYAQQQRRTSKGLFSNNRNNKHNAKKPLLEELFIPMAPKVEPPMGLKRYALVSTVFVLALYNIHLYFSQ